VPYLPVDKAETASALAESPLASTPLQRKIGRTITENFLFFWIFAAGMALSTTLSLWNCYRVS